MNRALLLSSLLLLCFSCTSTSERQNHDFLYDQAIAALEGKTQLHKVTLAYFASESERMSDYYRTFIHEVERARAFIRLCEAELDSGSTALSPSLRAEYEQVLSVLESKFEELLERNATIDVEPIEERFYSSKALEASFAGRDLLEFALLDVYIKYDCLLELAAYESPGTECHFSNPLVVSKEYTNGRMQVGYAIPNKSFFSTSQPSQPVLFIDSIVNSGGEYVKADVKMAYVPEQFVLEVSGLEEHEYYWLKGRASAHAVGGEELPLWLGFKFDSSSYSVPRYNLDIPDWGFSRRGVFWTDTTLSN